MLRGRWCRLMGGGRHNKLPMLALSSRSMRIRYLSFVEPLSAILPWSGNTGYRFRMQDGSLEIALNSGDQTIRKALVCWNDSLLYLSYSEFVEILDVFRSSFS